LKKTKGKATFSLEIAIGAIIYILNHPVTDLNSLYSTALIPR